MPGIATEILIAASPERVWSVLADFASYSLWNPLNIWAEGEASPGARVRMRFVDAGGGGRVISQMVTVTACDPPRRLEWVGRIPLLFEGRHRFDLEPVPGGTRVLHGERLRGLVPMTFSPARLERQRQAYEAMNAALARRVAEAP